MKAMPFVPYDMYSEARSLGRLAKILSWVFKNSSAAWGVETTIVGTWPSRNDMMGPYFLAKVWRARCGRLPSMWRLPMIGKARGPGGRDREEEEQRMCMNVHMDPSSSKRMANVNGDI